MQSTIKLFTVLLILVHTVSSCSKKGEKEVAVSTAAPSSTDGVATQVPKPAPFFKIGNLVNETTILEGNILDISMTPQKGVTYTWDFGEGTTSNLIIPQYFYSLCSRKVTITLKATNSRGESISYAKSYDILCSRGTAGNHTPVTTLTDIKP